LVVKKEELVGARGRVAMCWLSLLLRQTMDIEIISSSAFGFHFCGPNASLSISIADKNIAIKTTHKI